MVTGNPVIDAELWIAARPEPPEIQRLLAEHHIGPGENRLVLVTAHRRENFGEPIEQICRAIRKLADDYGGKVKFIYPVHLNPHVQEPVYRLLGNHVDIVLMPPLDYLPMVHLMKHSDLVLTDSGGLQEEAPGLGKPVLVLRDVTERPEGVETGVLKLIGTDETVIHREVHTLLDDPAAYGNMARSVNPYGDGKAAERIRDAILADAQSKRKRGLMLADHAGKTIGIIPDVRGLGGPASFHQKFVSGLKAHQIDVSYDLNRPDLSAVLVIAGSKHIRLLREVRDRGIPITQRLDGMNWVHRRKFTGVKHFLRSESQQLDPADHPQGDTFSCPEARLLQTVCMTSPPYRGRFGPLTHRAHYMPARWWRRWPSWLDARAHAGQWLVRIEDVDTTRCLPGMDQVIRQQLAACGLHSDLPVLVQSQRSGALPTGFEPADPKPASLPLRLLAS